MATFRDEFSSVASAYAAFRPRYPAAMIAHLASLAPARETAWDCATGNGQAATALADHFRAVHATDASVAQLGSAERRRGVHYAAALGEAAPFRDRSVSLVTIAQALHWLNIPRFFEEVRRVLVPDGIVAAWCYSFVEIDGEIDPVLSRFYSATLGPYWAPERRLVDARYRTIALPFEELETPAFEIVEMLTLEAFASYVRTWSAVLRYRQTVGQDPVVELVDSLRPRWGDGSRRVRWPLSLRVGRR